MNDSQQCCRCLLRAMEEERHMACIAKLLFDLHKDHLLQNNQQDQQPNPQTSPPANTSEYVRKRTAEHMLSSSSSSSSSAPDCPAAKRAKNAENISSSLYQKMLCFREQAYPDLCAICFYIHVTDVCRSFGGDPLKVMNVNRLQELAGLFRQFMLGKKKFTLIHAQHS